VNARLAQTLPGDWNIFREKYISPIGSFAFEDGWFWFIPVPKIVQGRRVLTHSLGMVTDPHVLSRPGKRFTDPRIFMETARRVPFLGDLIADAEVVSDKFLTATNYSRISGQMCHYDTGEIRVGDAAYFVDPLFSSGVHFALLHSGAALALIKARFDASLREERKGDLWLDYNGMLSTVARGFCLGIDQWYNESANAHPGSIYWRLRGDTPTFAAREDTERLRSSPQGYGSLKESLSPRSSTILLHLVLTDMVEPA
jgi:hypothetical protein